MELLASKTGTTWNASLGYTIEAYLVSQRPAPGGTITNVLVRVMLHWIYNDWSEDYRWSGYVAPLPGGKMYSFDSDFRTIGPTKGNETIFQETEIEVMGTLDYDNRTSVKVFGKLFDRAGYPFGTNGGSTGTIDGAVLAITIPIPELPVPSASAAEAYIGEPVTIYTNRLDGGMTHTIRYSTAGTEAAISGNVEDSVTWDIPYSLAVLFPNDTETECTIYSDIYKYGVLQGTKSTTLTLKVPDNDITKPFMEPEAEAVNSLDETFEGMLIQGKSDIVVTFHAGSLYSNVAKCEMTVEGNTYTAEDGTARSNVVGASGAVKAVLTVTDTRGYSTQREIVLSSIEYSAPGILNARCERCDEQGVSDRGGLYVKTSFDPAYSSVDGKNSTETFIRWKQGGGEFSEEQSITGEEHILDGITVDPESTYQVQIIIRDAVGEESRYNFSFASAFHTMHLRNGGKGVAFGKKSDRDGLEIAMQAIFTAGIGGTKLPAGSDLNDITTVGKYLVQTQAANMPCSGHGSLYVFAAYDPDVTAISGAGQDLIQIYVSGDAEIYIRSMRSITSAIDISLGLWKKII